MGPIAARSSGPGVMTVTVAPDARTVLTSRAIRVTIETGHDNALANDYWGTAYWYQLGRTEPLPPLAPVEKRIPRR